VILRLRQNKTAWRTLAILFCALVFFFALHAKTAVYNNGAAAKLTPSTSSKMWSSGQKLETRALATDGGLLLWAALFCLIAPYFRRQPRHPRPVLVPAPSNLRLSHLHRFLRPPPVLA
jgi:hypothetical protein